MSAPAALPDGLASSIVVRGFLIEYEGAARLALSPDEVGRLLGLSGRQVRRLCVQREIRARVIHPGSPNPRYLISAQALIEFVEGRATASAEG